MIIPLFLEKPATTSESFFQNFFFSTIQKYFRMAIAEQKHVCSVSGEYLYVKRHFCIGYHLESFIIYSNRTFEINVYA